MVRHLCMISVYLLLSISVSASEPDIRLPVVNVQPALPKVQPAKYSPVSLSAESLYVIDSDVPLLVLDSPVGIVSKTFDTGPVKVRGKFVGGSDKVETKTYKGKFVYVIEAAATGQVELLIVPVGADAESSVKRVSLDVRSSDVPKPNPVVPEPVKPVEPPKPIEPPAPIAGEGFRVLMVFDSEGAIPAKVQNAIFSTDVTQYLLRKCAIGPDGKTREFRRWPNTVSIEGESKTWKDAFARPRSAKNWIVISNGKTGVEKEMTEDMDGLLALLKKYGGE